MRAVAFALFAGLVLLLPTAVSAGPTPTKAWSAAPGSFGVALDPSGGAYTARTESFWGPHGVVQKRGPDGAVLWERRLIEHAIHTESARLAVAPDGGFVAGAWMGTDGTCVLPGLACGLVAKYAPDGTLSWIVPAPQSASGYVHVRDVSLDASGDVYLALSEYGARAAIAKLRGSDGGLVWRTLVGIDHTTSAWGVAAGAPGGGAYLTGAFGTAKISAGGSIEWTSPVQGKEVATDATGHAYVVSDGFPGMPAPQHTAAITPLGALAWLHADAAGAVTASGGLVVTMEATSVGAGPACVAVSCGLTSVYGHNVRAYDASGALAWGFFETIGSGLPAFTPGTEDVSIAGGRLAVTSLWRTDAYLAPIVSACGASVQTSSGALAACTFA
jgi:hypothetical protein